MNTTPPFVYTEGNDPPADPATKSYFSNHIGLLVSDLTATRQWYSDVLGMRHIFTVDVSPSYSVMYMGHSQGGKNGSGYQTGQEMARDRGNLAGLVEFIWNKRATFSRDSRSTFSHIGVVVDDLAAAEKRFDAMGVTVVKRPGMFDFSAETGSRALAWVYGFSDLDDEETQADIAATLPGLTALDSASGGILMVADPDGNLVEVLPQDAPAA